MSNRLDDTDSLIDEFVLFAIRTDEEGLLNHRHLVETAYRFQKLLEEVKFETI